MVTTERVRGMARLGQRIVDDRVIAVQKIVTDKSKRHPVVAGALGGAAMAVLKAAPGIIEGKPSVQTPSRTVSPFSLEGLIPSTDIVTVPAAPTDSTSDTEKVKYVKTRQLCAAILRGFAESLESRTEKPKPPTSR